MKTNHKCEICKTTKFLKSKIVGAINRDTTEKYDYVQCCECNLIFLNPPITDKEIKKLYKDKNYWAISEYKNFSQKTLAKKREENYGFLYKIIFNKIKKRGVILDMGMGNGLFLSKFKEKGWKVIGTEISSIPLRFAKERFGIQGRMGDFLNLSFPKKYFDVICITNVLEHIPKPVNTLKKIYSCLKDEGYLFITVPNIESLGFKIFGKDWYSLDPGRHLFLFSPLSVKKILEKTGFRIEKISHFYKIHNYYSWFESIRRKFSPKFKIQRKTEMGDEPKTSIKKFWSLLIFLGKAVAKIGCFIGEITNRGEVILVYAKKKYK